MSVYNKLKLIYVPVPKTGSTSIRQKLHWITAINNDYDCFNCSERHYGLNDIGLWADDNRFTSYTKVGFVRNPWEWAVSFYEYHMRKVQGGRENTLLDKKLSFRDYLLRIQEQNSGLKFGANSSQEVFPCQPQYKYLVNNKEELVADFIGRFEQLDEDWAKLLAQLGLSDSRQLPVRNKGNYSEWKSYYTDELRELVQSIYAKDIELFNYSF